MRAILLGPTLLCLLVARTAAQPISQVEFRCAETSPGPGRHAAVVRSSGDTLYLYEKVELGNDDRVLGRTPPPLDLETLRAQMHHPTWQIREVAARHLGDPEWHGPEAMEVLVFGLGDEHGLVRKQCAASLRGYGPETIPALGRALRSGNSGQRKFLLQSIGELGPEAEALSPVLVELLESDDRSTRVAAAQVLAKLSATPREIVPHLLRLLRPDRDDSGWADHEAVAIMLELGRIGPDAEEAVPQLIELMEQLPRDPAENTCDSLIRSVQRGGIDALRNRAVLRCNEMRSRRRNAAATLGWIHARPELVVPALLESMRAHRYLHGAGALALAQFGPAAATATPMLEDLRSFPNDPQRPLYQIALCCLRGDCSQELSALTVLLDDVEFQIRVFAARRLGELGPAARPAMDRLRQLQTDEEPAVREAAAEAVRRVGG